MQRIEDTNQCGLVCQSTRQDRHRSAFRIAYLLDRHAAAISGPLLILAAQDTDPVHGRVKQVGFCQHTSSAIFALRIWKAWRMSPIPPINAQAPASSLLKGPSESRIISNNPRPPSSEPRSN